MVHNSGTRSVHMATNLPYLTKSKTGWYEYRRRIPERLRPSFGNIREFKKALRTTSLKEAVAKWTAINREYEATAQRYGRLQNSDGSPLSEDVVNEALAKAKGLERPVLRAGATRSERQTFEAQEEAWLAAVENLQDELANDYINFEQMREDYAQGDFFKEGYETPYRESSPTDPNLIAFKHAVNGLAIELKPTWRDAVENYLSVNESDKIRDKVKQVIYDKKMRSLFNKFGLSLGKQGSNVPLEAITRQQARAFKDQFNISTGNRYNNQLSAIVNCWNREFPNKTVQNPFAGLSNKLLEYKHSMKRRSFSPEEWNDFVAELKYCKNRELGLIGLIMAYTGCRTSEAAGLVVKDVRLSEDVPNIVFRSNEVRSMEKGGLERAVPIFEPLATHLKEYLFARTSGAAFFNRYGAPQHFANVSVQLNNILRRKLKILDKELVAYSLRHTIHDKGRAAKVEQSIHEYIVGHQSSGSSRVHQRYGTRTPPRAIAEDMKAILDQNTWDTGFD